MKKRSDQAVEGGLIRQHLPAVAGFGVPFVLVTYLAMNAGGYDLVLRNQVGLIVWWAILLGLAAGLLPVVRINRAGWIALAVFGSLVVWTAIATLTWTESTERGMIELSRVSTLLGVFFLLLLVQAREGMRRSISAVGAAVAVIAIVALASRFQPDWFPASGIPESFPISRLNYPLEYWNGLAALLAIGLAPLAWVAAAGRSVIGRALAAGVIPAVVLACYLTASRGGAVEAGVALAVLIVLTPKRLQLLLNLIVPAIGSALMLLLIAQRPELRDRVLGDVSSSQGTEMLWLTVGVFIGTALIQGLLARAIKNGKITLPSPSRKAARRTGVTVAIVGSVLAIAVLATGFVGDRWAEFKEPAVGNATVSRLGNLGSGERYLVWESAIDASAAASPTGTGPGTFEFWWAREGEGTQFVRDAHSIYLEALAELGPMGFVLVAILIFGPIGFAGVGAASRGSSERRSLLAVAASGMAAFAVAAGIDWAWEMTVLPVVFFVLVAATMGPSAESRRGRRSSRFVPVRPGLKERVGLVLGAGAAILVIAIPTVGASLIDDSQSLYREGDLEGALKKAEDAGEVQPYSATAEMQQALVQLELQNKRGALSAADAATDDEPTNWRTWYVLAQVSDAFGNERQAESARRRTRELNAKFELVEQQRTVIE